MNVFRSSATTFILRLVLNPSLQKTFNPKLSALCFSSTISMATSSITNSFNINPLTPLPHVRGMTVLDREKFLTVVDIPYVVVPAEKMKITFKALKPHLLKMRKLNPVSDENESHKRVLLHPQKYGENLTTFQKIFDKFCLGDLLWTKINLMYENWSSEDIFKAVLPEDSVGNVSSFSIIGHIIHLNLKQDLLDYKFLIGQVLLDKYPNIKTVVNKCETIDNTFRNFKMEHLVGDPNYHVLVKENNFQYAFDFDKVFWNPRLGSERNDMTKRLNSRDLVYDVFAGVGPFAVPMAKKGCRVHANDLNPDSYHWLSHNAKLNKVEENLCTYNLDGNDFIRTVVKRGLVEYLNSEEENLGSVHILMNLPAIALTFLKSFNGLLAEEQIESKKNMPIVHCYFFKRKDEEAADVISSFLSNDLLKDAEISTVRVVAPNKLMMRVTYRLLKNILSCDDNSISEPLEKRIKLSIENNNSLEC